MTYQTIKVSLTHQVATVTLHRPDVRNAFNETMVAELTHAFQMLGNDDALRAIVLAADGAAFCAGADLHWMQNMAAYSYKENLDDAAKLANMLRTIAFCPRPVVAKVQGDCYGGGMGLVAASDIAVAADSAHFCLSEVKLGLIPATISPYVIKAIGERVARRYFLTAERFTAQDAYRIGLVHETAHDGTLDAAVDTLVHALVTNGPHAVRQAKRLVQDVAGQPVTEALIADTTERIAQLRSSNEGKEGMRAFLEKRKPDWLK